MVNVEIVAYNSLFHMLNSLAKSKVTFFFCKRI